MTNVIDHRLLDLTSEYNIAEWELDALEAKLPTKSRWALEYLRNPHWYSENGIREEREAALEELPGYEQAEFDRLLRRLDVAKRRLADHERRARRR